MHVVADCAFRDVTLNTLFYDPVGGVVHAPQRQFLTDLGLPDSDLTNWTPTGGVTARGTIRPIGLLPPSATPEKWAVKGFARLVKSISKYPDLDATPVSDWYTEHRSRIAHDLNMTYTDRRGAPVVAGRGHLASFLKSFNVRVDDDLIGLCGEKGTPEDALSALEMVREVRPHLGMREEVLRGWGLRRVESIGGVLVVGDDILPGLAQLNPGTVNELILPSIGGTGERVVRHVVHGSTTIRAHAIDSPGGLFVELDDAGAASGRPTCRYDERFHRANERGRVHEDSRVATNRRRVAVRCERTQPAPSGGGGRDRFGGACTTKRATTQPDGLRDGRRPRSAGSVCPT